MASGKAIPRPVTGKVGVVAGGKLAVGNCSRCRTIPCAPCVEFQGPLSDGYGPIFCYVDRTDVYRRVTVFPHRLDGGPNFGGFPGALFWSEITSGSVVQGLNFWTGNPPGAQNKWGLAMAPPFDVTADYTLNYISGPGSPGPVNVTAIVADNLRAGYYDTQRDGWHYQDSTSSPGFLLTDGKLSALGGPNVRLGRVSNTGNFFPYYKQQAKFYSGFPGQAFLTVSSYNTLVDMLTPSSGVWNYLFGPDWHNGKYRFTGFSLNQVFDTVPVDGDEVTLEVAQVCATQIDHQSWRFRCRVNGILLGTLNLVNVQLAFEDHVYHGVMGNQLAGSSNDRLRFSDYFIQMGICKGDGY